MRPERDNMKTGKIVSVLLIALICLLTACGGNETPAAEPDPEKAMENFLAKLDAGNYVMNAGDYLKTTVASRDQVVFEYADDMYTDFAAVSVDNEAFQAHFDGDSLTDIEFICEGQAIDAAAKRLPNCWMDESISEGNIWNLFYNDPEDPLRFLSHDENVKSSLLSFVGYGTNAARLMEDVYLVLDKEDPDSARLQCVVNEDVVARINYDDIDLEITFGNAESNAAADAWMSAPTYPEARTAWTEVDEFVFNSVFLPGYGLEAVPFPEFATYAFQIDQENFIWEEAARMRDSRATEQDMADYAETLKKNGFAEVKDVAADGTEKTFYRKMLREAYACYSSIELEYNDGVDITAGKYYDFPKYEGLDAINEVITGAGYPVLPESDIFTSYLGTDRANEMVESWLYFFDYDLGLHVDMEYSDRDQAIAYMEEYEKALEEAGFTEAGPADEYEDAEAELEAFADKLAAAADGEEEVFESPDGLSTFRYIFIEDGKVNLLFKSQKNIPAAEADKMITEAGFPSAGLEDPINARDLRMFAKTRYGLDLKAYVSLNKEFESAEAAEAFLNDYEAALNAIGFDRANPEMVGCNKPVAIASEDGSAFVGIDFFPETATVYLDFRAE